MALVNFSSIHMNQIVNGVVKVLNFSVLLQRTAELFK